MDDGSRTFAERVSYVACGAAYVLAGVGWTLLLARCSRELATQHGRGQDLDRGVDAAPALAIALIVLGLALRLWSRTRRRSGRRRAGADADPGDAA